MRRRKRIRRKLKRLQLLPDNKKEMIFGGKYNGIIDDVDTYVA